MNLTNDQEKLLDEMAFMIGGKPLNLKSKTAVQLLDKGLIRVMNNRRVCITDLGRSVNNETKS